MPARLRTLFTTEHASLLIALVSGLLLTRALGWPLGHARWFGAKLGLVVFLLIPLEGMHAFASHALILGGSDRRRERGFSVEEMVRTLEGVVLVPALLLMTWLSIARPF